MNRADAYPESVQASGGDDEAHAVQQRALPGRQLRSVGVAMKDGEDPNQYAAIVSGGGSRTARPRPAESRKARYRIRFPGSGTPISPSIRRRPSPWETRPVGPRSPDSELRAPNPNATIASTWSSPETGGGSQWKTHRLAFLRMRKRILRPQRNDCDTPSHRVKSCSRRTVIARLPTAATRVDRPEGAERADGVAGSASTHRGHRTSRMRKGAPAQGSAR